MLLDKFVIEVTRGKKAGQYLRVTDEEHPVAAQLMGADPADFGPAALRLVAAGFDVIDINFGCPVKKVLGRCRGGYLLSQVDTALEIVARTARGGAVAHSGHRENAARGWTTRRRAATSFIRFSMVRSPWAWRPSPCMAARCSTALHRPQSLGIFCAS